MNTTSRTGLVPAKKKDFILKKKRKKSTDELPIRFEAMPMALSLRPFGGLYNPFSKGCSVLCNHPAPSGLKDIISQMKSSLTVDGKSVNLLKDKNVVSPINEHDNIPEDLVRRYTDTDSRPLTPTPTVTSVHTRNSTSSFINNRRCITPELGKNEIIKRKKIILDLRRTHSQETLYWKPSSDMSQSITDTSGIKPKSAGANEERKNKQQRFEDQRPNTSLGNAPVTDSTKEMEGVEIKNVQTCINEQHIDDEDIRRGKKRKKIKPTAATTTTTFHLSEDPETQVAALGPDSLNPSTRPSLIPNAASLLPGKEKRESEPVLLKGSFLTDEAFHALKTELDIDVIENTFDRYDRIRPWVQCDPELNDANLLKNATLQIEITELQLPSRSKPITQDFIFNIKMDTATILRLTVDILKEKLRECGLSTSGRKKELQDRLLVHFGHSVGQEEDEESLESLYEEVNALNMRPDVSHLPCQHRPGFTLKDLGDSIARFSGTNKDDIEQWLTEFEMNADILRWSDLP
ncbi:PREDICTED: uncharacterized protein LOC108361928 [Rhagoletis zephyria]|uniref:uncharacterized protein LOC108361928 n=1 Tax=Rhagoletis zephyria TaxID=28612 RepID=UPI0008115819|nr:PREDICTED: uncharacterized protein LOC108361928 [Rhagoletis zephyria]